MERKLGQPPQHIKKQRHYFANKGPSGQCYGFSSSHVWMWQLDHKEGWVSKNWSFRTVVPEKTLESRLDSKKIKPVNPKENHPWIFFGRTDGEAEASILWPPDAKSQLIAKDPDVEKDWRQEEEVVAEDEMVGWHHRLNGHEFEQTLKDRGAWRTTVHRVTKSWTWLSGYNNKAFFPLQNSREDSPPVWGLTTAYKHKLETAINTSSSAYSLAIDKLKSQEWLQMRKIRKWREEGRGTDGGGWEKGNNLRTTMWESRLGFMYVTQFNHTTTLSSVIVLIL